MPLSFNLLNEYDIDHEEIIVSEFGKRLRELRRSCQDENGRPLTQEKLADLLMNCQPNVDVDIDQPKIARWERGVATPRRELVVDLIKIFSSKGVLKTIQEANELLSLAGHTALTTSEEVEIFNKCETGLEGDMFHIGTPIKYPKQFFGQRRLLSEIYRGTQNVALNNYMILGDLRCGKSSLMHQIPHLAHDNCRQHLIPSVDHSMKKRFHCIYLDLKNPELRQESGLMQEILHHLHPNQKIPEEYDRNHYFRLMNKAINNKRSDSRMYILIDELQHVLTANAQLTQDFWDYLRYTASRHSDKLGFIVTSLESPTKITENISRGSPFWNIFQERQMKHLLKEEAKEMIMATPKPFSANRMSANDIDWIICKSCRWPVLIAVICNTFIESCRPEGKHITDWRDEALKRINIPMYRKLLEDCPLCNPQN